MAASQEATKYLVDEFEQFLKVTLQNQKLTAPAREHRQNLLGIIEHFKKTGKVPKQENERGELEIISNKIKGKGNLWKADILPGGGDSGDRKPLKIYSSPKNDVEINSSRHPHGNLPKEPGIPPSDQKEEQKTPNTDDEIVAPADFRQLLDTMKKKGETKGYQKNEKSIPITSARDLENPTFCGYLEDVSVQKSATLSKKTLIESWCVIKQGIFYIFDHEKERFQQDAFYLFGYRFLQDSDLTKDATRKPLAFVLRCAGKKSYYFIAKCKDDLDRVRQAVEVSQKANISVNNKSFNSKTDQSDYLIPATSIQGGDCSGEDEELYANLDDNAYVDLMSRSRDTQENYERLSGVKPELPPPRPRDSNSKDVSKKKRFFNRKKSK